LLTNAEFLLRYKDLPGNAALTHNCVEDHNTYNRTVGENAVYVITMHLVRIKNKWVTVRLGSRRISRGDSYNIA